MSTATTNTKIVVTKGLLKKFVHIADNRYTSRGRKSTPNQNLTYCRDVYWKRYNHFYRRIGKLIAKELGDHRAVRLNGYDDWSNYMDGLTENQLQTALNGMKVKLNPPPPPPVRTTPPPQHGTHLHSMGQGGVGGGEAYQDPGTSILPDVAPEKFNAIPQSWTQRLKPHTVNTDRQHQLQGKLRQALMSVSQCRMLRNQEDGDLDMDRLVDIGSGVNLSGLFVKNTAGKRLSVAVQIYADISSSMDCAERHDELQLRLCVALGSVLEKMRVPTQIIAYNDQPFRVKGWQKKIAQSMVYKMALGDGGTNMPHTLMLGFEELAKRRETRKLAVIISDGDIGHDPANPQIQLHCSENNTTWQGYQPVTLSLKKQYPTIETAFFGIGPMQVPDCAFDYKLTGLGKTIVEDVSNKVVKVIAGHTTN